MARTVLKDAIWEAIRRGEAIVVDSRSPGVFCRGHAAGALSVPYSERGFGLRVLVAAPEARAAVLVAGDTGWTADAAEQLAEAGVACLGVLPDDSAVWASAGFAWETLPEAPVSALNAESNTMSRLVLDVREPLEWETGYVPGAWLVSLGRLREELDRLPREREIVVVCEAGVRSATAASILRATGFRHVSHVPAGAAGYRRTGRPLAFLPGDIDDSVLRTGRS